MLSHDLALLYGAETKALNRAVKRNSERFPSDFMFQLIEEGWDDLRCQVGTSSWGGCRVPPYAFPPPTAAPISALYSQLFPRSPVVRGPVVHFSFQPFSLCQ